MRKITAWNWNKINQDEWLEPAKESYFLLKRWKKLKFNSFLDLGCGVGRHTILFAKNNFACSACDLSKSSIEQTKSNLEKSKVSAILNNLDMHEIKSVYKDNLFDCILSYRVINHTTTEKFKQLLLDIISILKPNGEAYIVVDAFSPELKQNKNYQFVEPLSGIKIGGIEDGIIHHFATPSEFLDLPNIKIISLYEVFDHLTDPTEFNPRKLYVLLKKLH